MWSCLLCTPRRETDFLFYLYFLQKRVFKTWNLHRWSESREEGYTQPLHVKFALLRERTLRILWLTRGHAENAHDSRCDEQRLLRYPRKRDPGDEGWKKSAAGDHDRPEQGVDISTCKINLQGFITLMNQRIFARHPFHNSTFVVLSEVCTSTVVI